MTFGLWVLAAVFLLAAGMGAPMGLAMLAAGFAYLAATHQDLGLVVDQTMNGLYNNYLLLAIPLFIFVANLMNASGVLERLLGFAQAMVGRLRGGLAHVNIVTNLIFSGMSGSAVADAAGPGLIVARMMTRDERYPRGFAAATSAVAATLGPLVPPSIPMIFYALIANVSVGALFLAGTVPALATAAALMGAIALIARRRNFPSEPPPPWNAIGAAAARAAGHSARHHLFRHRHADRGSRDCRRLCAHSGARDLSLDHIAGARHGGLRNRGADRRDRSDHVWRLCVQLCGRQRERPATLAQYPGRLAPVANRLPAVRQCAPLPAGDRDRRDHQPARDRSTTGAGRRSPPHRPHILRGRDHAQHDDRPRTPAARASAVCHQQPDGDLARRHIPGGADLHRHHDRDAAAGDFRARSGAVVAAPGGLRQMTHCSGHFAARAIPARG